MKFLILYSDYMEFLDWMHAMYPGLAKRTYDDQMAARVESLFGTADFCSSNLRKIGHEAIDLYVNNETMQRAWSREHGLQIQEARPVRQRAVNLLRAARQKTARTPLRHMKRFLRPISRSIDNGSEWLYQILEAQIKYHKPDVLFNQSMDGISARFMMEMKHNARLLIGQHAATQLPEGEDLGCYDLVVSSFPPTVEWFRQKGVRAELHRLGFEPRILTYLGHDPKSIDVSLIASFAGVHSSRVQLMEGLCARFPIQIWAPTVQHLEKKSIIHISYAGQAWGVEMYRILSKSRMTLNHHGDIAPYANNCRLYEATGVGTLLVTDWKTNLHELFEPGREVVAYKSPEECAELIRYYMDHEEERAAIARAGQERTLREHTYYHRMVELEDIVKKYM